MKRLLLTLCLLPFAFCFSEGQTTHNLEIIWQKAKPETSIYWRYWGLNILGGDVNGDGYSDFVSSTDCVLDAFGWLKWNIYIFNGGTTLSTIPSQVLTHDTAGGHPVMCIADFNHDGYGDLALGDAYGTGLNQGKGQVNIHYGSASGVSPTPDLVIGGYGSATATGFGNTISAGDINGDEISDLVVGAPAYPVSSDRNGRVYVYYGDPLGLYTWPDIILNGHYSPVYYENFGGKTACIDLNNDGYDDLLVSGPMNSTNAIGAGKVYYYVSKGAPIDTIADGWISGEGYEHNLGAFNVSGIDVKPSMASPTGWFGTPFWPTGSFGEGKCYFVPGDTVGELTPEWTVVGEDTGLGYWSSSAGYADDGSLQDFLVGASPAYHNTGVAYLWLRRPVMNNQYDAFIRGRYPGPVGGGPGDVLGAMVAPAGDVDGDGKDEFLVSNYYADSSNMIWLCKYTGPNAVSGPSTPLGDRPQVRLFPNVPNPFSRITTIRYQLAKPGRVSLRVYDVAGRLVRTLIREDTNSGSYETTTGAGSVTWDGRDNQGGRVAPGVYLYQFKAGGERMTGKMILLR
ncbi:MAG TPA: hypothetical protein DCY27_10995 [Desulfobacterales bacterium]|nr:hypothetical protein [Desulfobacterales bacterium]